MKKSKIKILFGIISIIIILFFILYFNSFFINNNGIYDSKDKLGYFDSKQELQNWLLLDQTDSLWYNDKTFDCEDFALLLQRNAFKDGYIISCQYQYNDKECYYHILNVAYIPNDNCIYIIEPQTDNIWKLCNID
jgi:hypothetical protein